MWATKPGQGYSQEDSPSHFQKPTQVATLQPTDRSSQDQEGLEKHVGKRAPTEKTGKYS